MIQTKKCSKCGETKPLEDFSPDSRMVLGRRSSCKKCAYAKIQDWRRRNPDKVSAQIARRPKPDPERTRANGRRYHKRHSALNADRQRRHKLGAPLGLYDQLLAEQGGVCAICGRPPTTKRHSLDHCHATGKFRGVLCHRCNMAIGHFSDDPEMLSRAIAYLQR